MLRNYKKFSVARICYCGKLIRKKSDYEGLYKQHKEFGLYPEGGLQGGDMYAIYKYPCDSILEDG